MRQKRRNHLRDCACVYTPELNSYSFQTDYITRSISNTIV